MTVSTVSLTKARVALAVLAMSAVSLTAQAQIRFQDVSDQAIDQIATESWGVSVGDYNADGWPDIFINNHRNRSSLHRNNGNGTFTDVMIYADKDGQFNGNRYADHHRGVFSDVDNDGDDDLIVLQLTRGQPAGTPNDWHRLELFSDNGYLTTSGNRTSSGDGWTAEYDTDCGHADWAFPMYGDLDGNGQTDFMCIFTGQFEFISPGIYNALDFAIEDFDNDMRQEIFGMVAGSFIDDAKSISATRAEAFLQYTYDVGKAGMQFFAVPPVTFTVTHRTTTETVTLNGGSQLVNTVNISYDAGSGYWTAKGVNDDSSFWSRYKTGYVIAEAAAGISDVTVIDPLSTSAPMLPRVMKVENGAWKNRTWSAGFREEIRCDAVVAGDFDNDKDQDLYLMCREGVENTANRMYENDGNGFFTLVTDVGADGRLGRGIDSNAGLAENAATLDYDNDGFLDIVVTNGKSVQPIRRGGAPTLLHNLGNGNHWIKLDLRASSNNYSAVGARVIATSGGVNQLRFQNAGLHRYSQNHQVIHFGLGQDSSTNLEIRWPDGQIENFTNVVADNTYRVQQGQGMTVKTATPVATFDEPGAGDDCGQPALLADLDEDLFLYRTSCSSNVYQVRVTGGTRGNLAYTGSLTTSGGSTLSNINQVMTESSDTFNASSSQIDFTLLVGRNDTDGFSFSVNGSDACLTLSSPARSEILVGPKHLPVNGRGVNPVTLETCFANVAPAFTASPVTVSESDGTATVDVTLTPASSSATSVSVATQEGSATAPEDFYGHYEVLNFAAGETSKTVTFNLVDDNAVEVTEFFQVRLFAASNAVIETPDASITVLDDDTGGSSPELSVAPTNVGENNGPAVVNVSLSQASASAVTVSVSTTSGTAVKGVDYYGMYEILTFAAGETTKSVNIFTVDDTLVEGDETFTVRLFAATGASISTEQAIVSIIDDDSASTPTVSVTPISVNENAGTIQATVTLSSAAPGPVTVSVSSTADTASKGVDYYGFYQLLTFATGQTTKQVSIQIVDDALNEANEQFNVRLFNATGANIQSALTPITILDDD